MRADRGYARRGRAHDRSDCVRARSAYARGCVRVRAGGLLAGARGCAGEERE